MIIGWFIVGATMQGGGVDCGEVGCWVVSSLRVAPPWRPAGNQRLILMGILRWLFCHRTWCQGAIASLAHHSAVGLVFWLEVSVTADCDCGSNSLDF